VLDPRNAARETAHIQFGSPVADIERYLPEDLRDDPVTAIPDDALARYEIPGVISPEGERKRARAYTEFRRPEQTPVVSLGPGALAARHARVALTLLAAAADLEARRPTSAKLAQAVAPTESGVVVATFWESAEARDAYQSEPEHREALQASGMLD
jgi:hypothetical protein